MMAITAFRPNRHIISALQRITRSQMNRAVHCCSQLRCCLHALETEWIPHYQEILKGFKQLPSEFIDNHTPVSMLDPDDGIWLSWIFNIEARISFMSYMVLQIAS